MMKVLVDGCGVGPLRVLSAPVSFWGGVNAGSGEIVDGSHPDWGLKITGTILALPHGRGSSSSATVLAEMVRTGTAPSGIILDEADEILVAGAFVANRLYGSGMVVAVGQIPEDRGGIFQLDGGGLHRVDPTGTPNL